MKMREQNGRVLFPLILSILAGVQHRPVSDSEPPPPRRPGPTQGDAGQEQPGIEGRPEQKTFLQARYLFLFLFIQMFCACFFVLE